MISTRLILLAISPITLLHADASPERQWIPLPEPRFETIAGSALDFSDLIDQGPAGQHGFAFIRRDGKLAFEKRPEETLRFLAAVSGHMAWFSYSKKSQYERYATQLRRNGYNIFRPHFLDAFLCLNPKDGLFNQANLARWDAFAATLKEHGIYLYLDLSTSSSLFMPREHPSDKATENRYLAMYCDAEAREEWWSGVSELLMHANPHTGIALKDDPQVVAMQLRNEAGAFFQVHITKRRNWTIPQSFVAGWQEWLKNRYSSLESLPSGWAKVSYSDDTAATWKTLDDIPLPHPWDQSIAAEDFARFVQERETDLLDWQREKVRSLGAKLPLVDFNNGFSASASFTRAQLELVEGHGYHQHPSGYGKPGARIKNTSAIKEAGSFLCRINSGRYYGKPFFVTEWGIPYWNRWRHEALLLTPAMAGLQNWDLLSQHANQIRLDSQGFSSMRPFNVVADPVARATERACALLFLRGDIEPHSSALHVPMDERLVFEIVGPSHSLPNTFLAAAWITRLALATDPEDPAIPENSLNIRPEGKAAIRANIGAETTIDQGVVAQANWLQALQEANQLPPNNRTDSQAGFFESSDGRVILDAEQGFMSVSTDRSEGAILSESVTNAQLRNLKIESRSGPLAFLVASIDGQALPKSRRLLLIAISDARNSGMTFRDAAETTLESPGHAPALIQAVDFILTLDTMTAPELKAWALSETGERIEQLATKIENGSLLLEIDTAAINATGPYFELSAN